MILGAIIVLEVIYAIWSLRSPIPPPAVTTKQQATIILSSAKSQYNAGEAVPVLVEVSTGGRSTEGVDLVLNFDPRLLEVSSGAAVKGEIYPEYPQIKVDPQAGVIQISGISGLSGRQFAGRGNFATINFKAKASGAANLTVNFTPGKTDDSNIVEALSGNDVLESVSDLTLTVK